MQLQLLKKPVFVAEPVFKTVKRVFDTYNALAMELPPLEKIQLLQKLLDMLINDHTPRAWWQRKITIKQLSATELQAFLQAIPTICGLENDTSQQHEQSDTDFWAELYAHLSLCFGWDWQTIDTTMTFSRLKGYQAHLKQHPPTHALVAAYLGVESKPTTVAETIRSFMGGTLH